MFRAREATAEADSWECIPLNPQIQHYGEGQPVSGGRSDGAIVALEIGLKALIDAQQRYLVGSQYGHHRPF